jgi:hypothetical protein
VNHRHDMIMLADIPDPAVEFVALRRTHCGVVHAADRSNSTERAGNQGIVRMAVEQSSYLLPLQGPTIGQAILKHELERPPSGSRLEIRFAPHGIAPGAVVLAEHQFERPTRCRGR